MGIEAGLAAEAVVDLGAELSLSSDLVPHNAATNFPKIVADFTLDWGIGDRSSGVLVLLDNLEGSFLKGEDLRYVGFENVGLDLGSFFTDVVGPVVQKIQEVTEPIKPFLDFLTTPIPIISQLAGDTTLLDLATRSGFINPGIIDAIEVVDQVVDLANSLQIPGDGNVVLMFGTGEFPIYDARQPKLAALGAGSGPDLSDPNLKILDYVTLPTLPEWKEKGLNEALNVVDSTLKEAVGKMRPGGSASSGFTLPIIEDPSKVFGLLLGQPADIIRYDMAPLELDADYSAFFPLLWPLGVSINADFSALIDFAPFGYDTTGIQSFAASGFRNPNLLFDGFYVDDLLGGKDVAELQFDAGLWAAAELNLAIARGGVAGGLFANLDFDLHDPNADGRVRIAELIANAQNGPLAVFDVSGSLTAELFAFLDVNVPFLSIHEKWDITEPVTLLDYNETFEREPVLATDLGDGVLQLNMGKFAEQRVEGDINDGNETFTVRSRGNNLEVTAFGLTQEYESKTGYFTKILALGGEGNDTIDLKDVSGVIGFDLEGGAGDNVIKAGFLSPGGPNPGRQRQRRDLGSAPVTTRFSARPAMTSFMALPARTGCSATATPRIPSMGTPSSTVSGSTTATTEIFGEEGEDLLFGGGGNDTLEGGAGADVLIGDAGKITVNGNRRALTVEDTSRVSKGGRDILRGQQGNDRLYGGYGNDTLEGGDDDDLIYGEAGLNIIDGGSGGDTIHGGAENDHIGAGAATTSFTATRAMTLSTVTMVSISSTEERAQTRSTAMPIWTRYMARAIPIRYTAAVGTTASTAAPAITPSLAMPASMSSPSAMATTLSSAAPTTTSSRSASATAKCAATAAETLSPSPAATTSWWATANSA